MTRRWKGLPILSELSEAHAEALAEEITERWVEPDVPLFGEGDPGGSLWILLDGRVRVTSRALALRSELGGGAALGALALLGGARRATVETVSRCRLLRLGRDGFDRLRASDPAAAEQLVEVLVRDAGRLADEALAARTRAGVDPPTPDD